MTEEYAGGTRGASGRALCKIYGLWKATIIKAERRQRLPAL
jgi:hypothetical protein